MGDRITRKYGLPWAGYMSSVPAHLVPPNKAAGVGGATPLSRNLLFDPAEGKFYRRAGSTVLGGTAGILEDGTGELTVARARKVFSLDSPSIDDLGTGYPTYAALYTEEGNHNGCLYLRSPIGGANYVLGSELQAIPANHYTPDRLGTAGTHNFKVIPYFRTSGNGGSTEWGRLNTPALRAWPFAGSRNCVEMGGQLCFPDLDTLPMRWGKRYNEVPGVGTQNLRLSPLGHLPPPPSIIATSGTANASGSWVAGDSFYYSYAFEFSDGSISPPAIPRDRNNDLSASLGTHMPAGLMKVVLAGTAGVDKYLSVDLSGIGKGPDGCVARRIYRTPKKEGFAGVNTIIDPAALDLRLTAIIKNNTQTEYIDPNGNDLALIAIDLEAEFGKSLCPPARYMWPADNRLFVGYTKRNPAAIVLWPNINANDDSDDADADGILDICENNYEFLLSAGVITLKLNNSAGTAITADSTRTIQRVVDAINATTGAGSGGKWYAAVAPGADPNVTCGTSAANNQNLASTTSVDVADTQYAATGRVRSFGFSLPAILYYSTTYLADFPTERGRFFHTQAGPLLPANACNAWDSRGTNYRTVPDTWGDMVGGAPLLDGTLIFCSKGIGVYRNTVAGKNGLDRDYILTDLFPNLGCIAWDSITWGNGWAGCLTNEGYCIFDGQRGGKAVISADVWNPQTSTGEWGYEIQQCIAAVSGDSDLARFHAKAMGGKLYITYRSDSSTATANRMLIYDFSASQGRGGIASVLQNDGNPWPWSTPQILGLSVLGEVGTATGMARYGAVETNAGATSNGRIEQFETGTQDNGAAIATQRWTARDFVDSKKRKHVQNTVQFYKKAATGMTLRGYRDGLGTTADMTITLPSTASNNFDSTPLPVPQAMNCGARSIQFRLDDDGTSSAHDDWGIEADVLIADSYT